MDTNFNNTTLESINTVHKMMRESKLKDTIIKKINEELEVISTYFQTNKKESLLIALVFAENYRNVSVDFNDLSKHLECSPLQLLCFSNEIQSLINRGILVRKRSSENYPAFSKDQFTVNKFATEAIILNLPLPELKKIRFETDLELIECCFNLAKKRTDELITTSELQDEFLNLLEENNHLNIVRKINTLGLSTVDRFVMYYMIWKTISGEEEVNLSDVAECVYNNPIERIHYIVSCISKKNPLVTKHLIEVESPEYMNYTTIKFTNQVLDMLAEAKIIDVTIKKVKNSILPTDIKPKTLFYNETEIRQIEMLKKYMKPTGFKRIQKRLKEKYLPSGLTVLLYGYPGTGKTETVFQLARQTGRSIIHVDISNTKSCWFGESEKIIKRVFNDYRDYNNKCKHAPILLFNEADAVLSKRRENFYSPVSQTENAIQNIILEELERFDGIFFATTNLVINLDKAFERRFLFKIQYSLPDEHVKTKIWKDKMPQLSVNDCSYLAGLFTFSGGQIENIVRKYEVQKILNGNDASLQQIVEFCEQEMILNKPTSRIGFNVN